MREAGTLLVELLENQKVDRVYCVPGESYLSVMNGLQDTSIETILCKHEGAASIMAEADGKLTGRPGIAQWHLGSSKVSGDVLDSASAAKTA